MAKYRLRFAKEGRAVYLSHLDLLRTFQRVFLRQGLVLRHSQGFHPHPILSFALPLPLGQSSGCEILDFEVETAVDAAALPEQLNPYMPEGIRALTCRVPARPIRELRLLEARVELLYDQGVPAGATGRIAGLFAGDTVVIQKRTKRKELSDVDLRPLIHRLKAEETAEGLALHVVAAAQNPGLNPALLETAIEKYLPELTPDFVRVHRVEVMDSCGGIFC